MPAIMALDNSKMKRNIMENKSLNKNKPSPLWSVVFSLALAVNLLHQNARAEQAPVNLRSAGNFVILSKSGITDVPASAITGNIGTSPITGAAITGLDPGEVTGAIYTVDAAGPAGR